MLLLQFCPELYIFILLVLATGRFLSCISFALRIVFMYIAVLRLAWSLFYLLGMLPFYFYFYFSGRDLNTYPNCVSRLQALKSQLSPETGHFWDRILELG